MRRSPQSLPSQKSPDITQMNIVDGLPPEPRQALDVFASFASGKNDVEAVRKLIGRVWPS